MTSKQEIWKQADLLAEQGMSRALDRANREQPEWAEMALLMIAMFARQARGDFQCADVREWAAARGVWTPEPRAWGMPMRRAVRLGVCAFVGYEKNSAPGSHGRPSRLYRPLLGATAQLPAETASAAKHFAGEWAAALKRAGFYIPGFLGK